HFGHHALVAGIDPHSPYVPMVASERVEQLRRWHDEVSESLHRSAPHDVDYLGLRLHVPAEVFPPTPVSDLLGRVVMSTVRSGHRVLDMGCGSGANAILAAQRTDDVVAVDVNPHAVAAAAANARNNGVGDRVRCAVSDVFERVNGLFDVIVFDPPFRWFAPRDLLERAITDENYETLGRFITEAPRHLRENGCILLFFGTSGDVGHLDALTRRARYVVQTVAERTRDVRGESTTYFVRRLAQPLDVAP
ncbi:MAG: methyltransferase, partial [Ilumatobacteraceae bacterium]